MRPSRRRWALASGTAACLVAAGASAAGCFGAGAPLERVVEEGPDDDDGTSSAIGTGPDVGPGTGPVDPHGPDGIDPPHGSFAGGLRAVIRGTSFREGTRVWIGDAEATDVVVLGPTRIQITTPPGPPGLVDVTTELPDDPSTRRTLEDAYTYDAFHLEPSIGPPAGGIVTRIVGEGTGWDAATEARIGGAPCTALEVVGPEELLCEVPPGTLGSKPVRVGPAGDEAGAITVLDAFTYDDAPEGAVGGLDGAPLDGRLEVRVFGAYTGEPLPGATIVVGEDLGDARVLATGGDGRAIVEDVEGPVTVTAALRCHQPTTFVDVGVERVTFYLDPILDFACIESFELPPPGGSGAGATRGTISGAISWGTVGEFERAPFGVPPPGPGERQVAYVFLAGSSPTSAFSLPPSTFAITPDAEGGIGFGFEMTAPPGNRVLYALAGLEDRNVAPPRFVPWSMGVLRGVVVGAGATTNDVVIEMRHPLEHALAIELAPPAPTPRGPDRVQVSTSIRLGPEGFLTLPQGRAVRPLPLPLPGGPIEVVGLPLLDGQLQGAAYEVHARAATGDALLLPLSAVAGVSTTVADTVQLGDFVGVPRLVTPAPGTAWDGEHLAIDLGAGGSVLDVVVLDVATAGELVRWKIAAPGDRRAVRVPDLRALGSGDLGVGLPPGPIDVLVTVGRVDGLDWGEVQYRHLRPQNMDAHALDTFDAHLWPVGWTQQDP